MEEQKDTIERQSWFKDVRIDLEGLKITDWNFSILADKVELLSKNIFMSQFFKIEWRAIIETEKYD